MWARGRSSFIPSFMPELEGGCGHCSQNDRPREELVWREKTLLSGFLNQWIDGPVRPSGGWRGLRAVVNVVSAF